jgi:hypothetical protein
MAGKELGKMLGTPTRHLHGPLIQLVVFGYAAPTDVRHVATWVVDHDRTAASRELVDRMTASGYFTVAGRSDRPGDAVRALEAGTARVALEIPPNYERDLAAGRATVQILVDGTDSNTGNIALGYGQRIVTAIALEVAGATPAITLASRAWYNPSLESRVFNVPAVIGILLLLVPMLLTSLNVVREREVGTWDQLAVSPISPSRADAWEDDPGGDDRDGEPGDGVHGGGGVVRHPDPGQPLALPRRRRPVHRHGAESRPDHLHHFGHAAGSLHDHVPGVVAGADLQRVHVPRREHAEGSGWSRNSTRCVTSWSWCEGFSCGGPRSRTTCRSTASWPASRRWAW